MISVFQGSPNSLYMDTLHRYALATGRDDRNCSLPSSVFPLYVEQFAVVFVLTAGCLGAGLIICAAEMLSKKLQIRDFVEAWKKKLMLDAF